MPEDRRLAAIMFTDIVGYTSLMGSDEDKAFEMLKKNHSIHEVLINKYNGTLIKEIGDGTLASFPLASDAVRCAMDIQKEAKDQNIPLKIGIHQGEMVMAGADVLGDGVNVASRLQEISKEGCITISGKVYSDIKNKSDINAKYIGEKKLKNVDDPVKVYEVLYVDQNERVPTNQQRATKKPKLIYITVIAFFIIVASFLTWKYFLNAQLSTVNNQLDKSIAVLPFKNLSNNPKDQYLADGVAESILNHLQRIEDLRVRSRTSTEPYRDTPKNMIQIGEELKVNYILEGSFQKVGDQANLIVQLIETGIDEHLWAEEYNRDWSDIFKVQKEVARSIADELYANLTREEKEGIDVIPTNNMTAYEYFLKGNEIYWEGRGTHDLVKINESFGYFERAIELDENFSLAYTGLGRIYWTLAHIEPETEKPELWNNAQKSLKKAIDLDPYNGWAYSEMGVIFHNWNWDSTAARSYAEMALKLTPNDWNSFGQYIVLEERIGNCEKVEKLLNIAKERFPQIDQNSYFSNNIPVFKCQQKWDEIAAIADENWDEMSNSTTTFMAYIHINKLDRADQVVRIMKERSFSRSYKLIWDAILYAKKGDKNSTLQTIDSLRQLSSSEYIANVQYAAIYATLGDKDQMYDHLELALSSREYNLHQLNNAYSVFIPYQNEDRFKEIWAKSWIPMEENE